MGARIWPSLLVLGLLQLPGPADAQDFVPEDFEVPRLLKTQDFRIEPLTIDHLLKDYDAVMTSRGHLRGTFRSDDSWPEDTLSLKGNLVDLGWHQNEFQHRSSFAYAVMSPDGEREVGCIYIFPSGKSGYDAEVYYWVRSSGYERGLEPPLKRVLKGWLDESWPFESVAYPGREISWQAWAALPDK